MDCLRLRRERAAIGVDRMDRPARAEEIGKREGEGAGAGSELEPRATGSDRVADEPDVVVVVYGAMSDLVRLRA